MFMKMVVLPRNRFKKLSKEELIDELLPDELLPTQFMKSWQI